MAALADILGTMLPNFTVSPTVAAEHRPAATEVIRRALVTASLPISSQNRSIPLCAKP